MLRIRPIPGGDDDVAFHALRTLWFCVRQLALGDTIGSVREIGEGSGIELACDNVRHLLAGLAGLDALHPLILGGTMECRRNCPGRECAKLVAAKATFGGGCTATI